MKRTVCVFNRNRESFLGLRVAPADTVVTRLKGLLGKSRLKPDDGVWIVPSRGVHTVGLLFSIDLVFLDEANRVIHLVENLRPFRISPVRLRSASVLQLRQRSIFASKTQIGDELLICAPDEMRNLLQAEQRRDARTDRNGVTQGP